MRESNRGHRIAAKLLALGAWVALGLFAFSFVALLPIVRNFLDAVNNNLLGARAIGFASGVAGLSMLLGWVGAIWYAATERQRRSLSRPALVFLMIVGNIFSASAYYWLAVRGANRRESSHST